MSTVGSVLTAVGGAPLVRLPTVTTARGAGIHPKLERSNPTGSYKDRMTLAMIADAERRGGLEPGMTVEGAAPLAQPACQQGRRRPLFAVNGPRH